MKFLDLVQILQMAIKSLLMYTDAHPRSQEALRSLTEGLGTWLTDKPSLHIAASNGKLFVDGAPLDGQNMHTAALARQLSEREIAGFILQRGVTADELLEMLKILILKPSKLEQMGGVAKVMADQQLRHITLGQIQYKAVREGEESGAGGPEAAPALIEGEVATLGLQESAPEMLERWREALEAALRASKEAASARAESSLSFLDEQPGTSEILGNSLPPAQDLLPADLAFLAPVARDLDWGSAFPTGAQLEALQQALLSLPGTSLWSVMAGLPSLPAAPGGLSLAFQALTPEMLSQATSKLLEAEIPWNQVKDPLLQLLGTTPHQQAILSHLKARLGQDGRVEELIHQVDWNHQSLEEKIQRALEGETLWQIGPDQRLALLRNLIDLEKFDTFLQILERILGELTSENVTRREEATRDLVTISQWMRDPGLPLEVQGPLIQGLSAHFGWEPILAIHRNTAKALEHVFECMVMHEEFAMVRELMQEIEGLCSFLDDQQEWRGFALAKLRGRLSAEDLMAYTMDYLHRVEPEKVLTDAIPYFEFLGEPAARELARVLGDEPDRRRRGRLLDVIRVMGPIAVPVLLEGLYSPTWYFVRNTLNLLADMGDAGLIIPIATCLNHADARVRASAIRALWKLGGPAASAPLLSALPTADPDTQVEILFGLGQIQASTAVVGILDLAKQSGASQKVRIKAVEALGLIASPMAAPALLDLLRRKGRIFSTAEPTELRVAIARALLAIGTPQVEAELRQIVADEPKNQDREALQRILDLHWTRT
ncbi:MAG: HEAT repeat domain-containing protein [Holophaga sp.]|nr:HEAT repeat domain-containing protein [Holophaga sp.]